VANSNRSRSAGRTTTRNDRTTTRSASSGTSRRTEAPTPKDQPRLVSKLGPIEVDIPRSIGYFGGVTLAVGAGLIEPPLGLFIAAVPFLKMLDLPPLPNLPRFVGQVFEGIAKPVGGDSHGTIRVVTSEGADQSSVAQD
jgi:hypothetical protein